MPNVQADSRAHSGDALAEGELARAAKIATEFHPPVATYDEKSAASESATLLKSLWRSPDRWRVVLLTVGIAAALVANIVGQIRLNTWNGSFFDALQQRNLAGLGHQLLIFFGIIGVLLTLVVAQTWLQQILKLRLREMVDAPSFG